MANRLQAVFLGVILGLLLIIIGIGAESCWVFLIGALIMPLVLFWGGLFLQDLPLPMRIAMLAVAVVVVAATIMEVGNWAFNSSPSYF